MDASGSIGVSNYVDAKTQLARLVGLLCPNPDPFMTFQRAALIRFSSSVDAYNGCVWKHWCFELC